jgi:hypothetical protein
LIRNGIKRSDVRRFVSIGEMLMVAPQKLLGWKHSLTV